MSIKDLFKQNLNRLEAKLDDLIWSFVIFPTVLRAVIYELIQATNQIFLHLINHDGLAFTLHIVIFVIVSTYFVPYILTEFYKIGVWEVLNSEKVNWIFISSSVMLLSLIFGKPMKYSLVKFLHSGED